MILRVLALTLPSATQMLVDASPVVLGETESVGITLTVEESPSLEAWPLRAAVNVGSISELRRIEAGTYSTVYVPPTTRFPQVALIALWRETGPDAEIEFLRLPLYGKTTLRVRTAASAEVVANVAETKFGPVTSNRSGRASVPMIVPPDVSRANVLVKRKNGRVTTKTQSFKVPPYNRLTAAVVPRSITTDEEQWARIDVFYDLGGPEVRSDRITIKAAYGEISLLGASQGRYSFRYDPRGVANADRDQIEITVTGDPVARASVDLILGIPPAARAVLIPPKESVPADGRPLEVAVLVLDAQGQGLPKQSLEVRSNGEQLEGQHYQGHGIYTFPWNAPLDYPPGGIVHFEASVNSDAAVHADANYQLLARTQPAHLTIEASPSPVPANGGVEASLSVQVRDEGGAPVEGAHLLAKTPYGVLSALRDQGEGRYEATYLPPRDITGSRVPITIYDADGSFESTQEIRLRRDPGNLVVGGSVGARLNVEGELLPRLMLEGWVPIRTAAGFVNAGLLAGFATRNEVQSDASGELASEGKWLIVPIEARVGYDIWANSSVSIMLGVGGTAVFAQFTNDEAEVNEGQWGAGGLGFGAIGVYTGPGQIFMDFSYSYSVVSGEFSTLDVGGFGLFAGYRVGL